MRARWLRFGALWRLANHRGGAVAGGVLALALAGGTSAAGAQTPLPPPASEAANSAESSACRVLDPELQGTYTGGCEDGLAQGEGVARGAHGAWYQGPFQAGQKSGYGVKLYANGDGYAGDWREDRRHGQGRYEFGPQSPWRGDVYLGGWVNDQREGQGTYTFFPSGDRFTTQWHRGAPQDPGTPTITRRKRVYEALAPVLGQPGLRVCSSSTQGANPQRLARGVVLAAQEDRIQVQLEPDSPVLAQSPDPRLNPRWEVMTDWRPCPEDLAWPDFDPREAAQALSAPGGGPAAPTDAAPAVDRPG